MNNHSGRLCKAEEGGDVGSSVLVILLSVDDEGSVVLMDGADVEGLDDVVLFSHAKKLGCVRQTLLLPPPGTLLQSMRKVPGAHPSLRHSLHCTSSPKDDDVTTGCKYISHDVGLSTNRIPVNLSVDMMDATVCLPV